MNNYIVSEAPHDKIHSLDGKPVYYCHRRDCPDIPVFGSIGDKTKANKVCRMMNGRITK